MGHPVLIIAAYCISGSNRPNNRLIIKLLITVKIAKGRHRGSGGEHRAGRGRPPHRLHHGTLLQLETGKKTQIFN